MSGVWTATVIRRSVDWILVAGRWTRVSVMTAGRGARGEDNDQCPGAWLRNLERDESGLNTVILMIPGNPGNEGFYESFGRRLLELLDARESVNASVISPSSPSTEDGDWLAVGRRRYFFVTVSHLNHVPMPSELRANGGGENHKHDDRFLLEDQVEHKLAFCREYLPRVESVYLLGHSIGAYMMLRILPTLIADGFNVVRACALFPTIERMAESPNGRRLYGMLKFVNDYDCLLRWLLMWLDWLPMSWRRALVAAFLRREKNTASPPACVVDSACELVNVDVLRNIVCMSRDELDTVCELDRTLLDPIDHLRFHYGADDGWCPIQYAREMCQHVPEEQIRFDTDGCAHAFVINDGDTVAERVLQWIGE